MINSPFSKAELNEIRSFFPHTESGLIYLNHAAISPLPVQVNRSVSHWLDIRTNGPVENFSELEETIHTTRQRVADYLNADSADQITFLGNTSDAISAVASGLNWSDGDEIILNTMEFPSNVQPFRRLESKGVKLIYIPHRDYTITADQIESRITPRTKMVSVSAVQYLSGYRADLMAIGKLCREKNLLFVVDGIQALGASTLDVEACHIDAVATGAHKWLMAPMGIGFLYLSKKLQKTLTPFKTGWLSVENPWELSEFDHEWLPVSAHLETGTPNMLGIAGLGESLKLFNEIGTDHIKNHILYLTEFILNNLSVRPCESITKPDEHQRLGIVSFSMTGTTDYNGCVEELKGRNITISSRENHFRVSPHYYNTEEEIETVLDHLFTAV